MIEIEVLVPARVHNVPQLVGRTCALEGLEVSLKGTLARYPGSVHWHLKKGKRSGTLELTWWERENRLWFKVAAGRNASWINPTIERLRVQLEQAFLPAE